MRGDQRVALIAVVLLVLAVALIVLLALLAGEGPCLDAGGAPGCNGELF